MPNFNDLQNTAIWRLRQRGVNFGAQPNNGAGDSIPPYIVQLLLNQGYNEFIDQTKEAKIVTLKLPILTPTEAVSAGAGITPFAINLRPLPPQGSFTGTVFTPGAVNPAVNMVTEATYTTAVGGQNAGYEYEIELSGEQRFKALAGDYTRRLSWFGPRVLYAARLERKPLLDLLPATASYGDTIALTIVPDPLNSPLTCPCSNGGQMQLGTDVPLLPPEFHGALVEYVVMNAGDAADKGGQVTRASDKWDSYVAKALWSGAVEDGGYPVTVRDIYTSPVVRE